MKMKIALLSKAAALAISVLAISVMTISVLTISISVAAQETDQSGFVITLKNGSTIRGRTLSRDDQTGKLRLAMTETGAGEARSYAVISPEDASDIRSSSSATDSITIKLRGGSQIKCKEFALSGDTVSVKLGSASRIEVQWSEIEAISFAQ
jgi:hypothetical protein